MSRLPWGGGQGLRMAPHRQSAMAMKTVPEGLDVNKGLYILWRVGAPKGCWGSRGHSW